MTTYFKYNASVVDSKWKLRWNYVESNILCSIVWDLGMKKNIKQIRIFSQKNYTPSQTERYQTIDIT